MRADARRNYERILATAREAFRDQGVDVPLDDIAKRAAVGPGTLYRHFPSRDALVEAVYREEITKLADVAYRLRDELPPGEGLFAWMREQVHWIAESYGLASALRSAIDDDSETFAFCKKQMRDAASSVLEPARAAGVVRTDLEPSDLLRLGHGVGAAARYTDADGVERLLTVVIDGMRAGTAS
ncbi:MAG TPA: helix-turn-helix domain-containing protein [Actinophytocola sp.]|uniref:TetR/AcrR family transcriptional regulator n=1 Tax=Actinophytocola sp. TaxID=1872138 RepID=UPI002F9478B3